MQPGGSERRCQGPTHSDCRTSDAKLNGIQVKLCQEGLLVVGSRQRACVALGTWATAPASAS